jgi:hypothetical protein
VLQAPRCIQALVHRGINLICDGAATASRLLSFQAHAPENHANGGFSVESDEYQLFLKRNTFDSDNRGRKWTPDEAAHRLWEELLENAGINYD